MPRTGRTLLLSIHQITDAARVCDRFVLLSGGRVRGEGTLEELVGSLAARSRGAPTAADLEEVFLALTYAGRAYRVALAATRNGAS